MARFVLVTALCFSALFLTHKCVAQEITSRLEAEFKGKTVTLRGFYRGGELHFGADGKLLKGGKPGPWTLYSKVQVDGVTSDANGVQIQGHRLGVLFPHQDQERAFVNTGELRIDVDVTPSSSLEDIELALKQIFLRSDESLADAAPPSWKHFLSGGGPFSVSEAVTLDGKPTVKLDINSNGPRISPPRAVLQPDPQYEPYARSHRLEGTVVLWCIVNERGTPEKVSIMKPMGFGLDEGAVEAVSRWKFQPAKQEGKAVPVQINVEVNFRLN